MTIQEAFEAYSMPPTMNRGPFMYFSCNIILNFFFRLLIASKKNDFSFCLAKKSSKPKYEPEIHGDSEEKGKIKKC